jgi:hypothetical protein
MTGEITESKIMIARTTTCNNFASDVENEYREKIE